MLLEPAEIFGHAGVTILANPLEWLGYAAGATLAVSGMPKYLRNLKYPAQIDHSELSHYALIALGNTTWSVYGVLSGIGPVTLFCTINAIMHAALIVQLLRQRA